jgi:hypothetical protein
MLIAGGAVFAADRLSKWWVVEWLDLEYMGRIEVLPPYLNFVMAWNPGINFGLFSGFPEVMRWLLVVVAVAISAALVCAGQCLGPAAIPRRGGLSEHELLWDRQPLCVQHCRCGDLRRCGADCAESMKTLP